jgi:CRISPR system Cascade subunit CasC
MTTFLQLHLLTSYPAANLNRDDTGRPKTLRYGGVDRLRVSSQSLKRAIRTSDLFETAMNGAIGTRSQSFAKPLLKALMERSVPEAEAIKRVAKLIEDEKLGVVKKGAVETEQLVHLAPEELQRLDELADRLAASEDIDAKSSVVLLRKPKAVDIALFGRMLADNAGYNVEAAAQVAHAFTTHRVTVEDDYYTTVDDLKNRDRDADRGAGFIGVQEYGAGVFYLYVCIDVDLLVDNLDKDKKLARAAVTSFIDAASKVSPTGKQNSFASRARATYLLLETGPDSPRSLAGAFLKPVGAHEADGDTHAASVNRLTTLRDQFAHVYGDASTDIYPVNVPAGEGSFGTLLDRAGSAVDGVNA